MILPLVFGRALMLWATGAWADRYDDCNQSADPDRRIRGCTQVIERGEQESRKNRATANYNRGLAYRRKGEVDRAIADYDEAIKLNPNYAIAYNNRGVAYEKKGDKEKAISDYREALKIDPSHGGARNNLKALGVTP
jgi:Tfp pilus assembly protein PilF